MERAKRPSGRRNRIIGVAAIVAGATLGAAEFFWAPYLVVGTLIVLAVVWPMVRGRANNSAGLRKQILLSAAVASGFWFCTTAALRFADSGDANSGAGAASLVSVSPWGTEMNASELMVNGVASALSFALIAYGAGLVTKKESHRRRRMGRSRSRPVSPVATQPAE